MVRINIDDILATLPVIETPHRGGCGSCGSGEGDSRCGNGLEKIYPTTAVRFGYRKHIGEFSYPPGMKFSCGAKVVIQTSRGLEIGEQVSLTCGGCAKSVTREQIRTYVQNSGESAFLFDAGRIIREANRSDLAECARIQSVVPRYRDLCRQLARKHGLDIKVVECELLFGGERAIFYFISETRVDFRGLVRDLSAELQTRIQMEQIGARDEARLLADYETCGRECCCKVFLKDLKPVSMKMAKLQKQTIDPSKVSGRCGRLKCCLRYEHEGYEELAKKLPRIGARVRTAHGDGVVINRQILTQLVQIRTDDERTMTVVVEDILRNADGSPPESRPAAAQPHNRPGRAGEFSALPTPPSRPMEGRESSPPVERSSAAPVAVPDEPTPTRSATGKTFRRRSLTPHSDKERPIGPSSRPTTPGPAEPTHEDVPADAGKEADRSTEATRGEREQPPRPRVRRIRRRPRSSGGGGTDQGG